MVWTLGIPNNKTLKISPAFYARIAVDKLGALPRNQILEPCPPERCYKFAFFFARNRRKWLAPTEPGPSRTTNPPGAPRTQRQQPHCWVQIPMSVPIFALDRSAVYLFFKTVLHEELRKPTFSLGSRVFAFVLFFSPSARF